MVKGMTIRFLTINFRLQLPAKLMKIRIFQGARRVGIVENGLFCRDVLGKMSNFVETLEGDAENLADEATDRLLAALE